MITDRILKNAQPFKFLSFENVDLYHFCGNEVKTEDPEMEEVLEIVEKIVSGEKPIEDNDLPPYQRSDYGQDENGYGKPNNKNYDYDSDPYGVGIGNENYGGGYYPF